MARAPVDYAALLMVCVVLEILIVVQAASRTTVYVTHLLQLQQLLQLQAVLLKDQVVGQLLHHKDHQAEPQLRLLLLLVLKDLPPFQQSSLLQGHPRFHLSNQLVAQLPVLLHDQLPILLLILLPVLLLILLPVLLPTQPLNQPPYLLLLQAKCQQFSPLPLQLKSQQHCHLLPQLKSQQQCHLLPQLLPLPQNRLLVQLLLRLQNQVLAQAMSLQHKNQRLALPHSLLRRHQLPQLPYQAMFQWFPQLKPLPRCLLRFQLLIHHKLLWSLLL